MGIVEKVDPTEYVNATEKVMEAPGASPPEDAQYGLPPWVPAAFVAVTPALFSASTSSIGPAIATPLVFVTVKVSVPIFETRL